jgi:2-keto-3-deoxy-L-fuconate dehydrogenase
MRSATGRLQGKKAFITGAGQGIGRATAEVFVQEGASVVAADRNAGALAALAADLPGTGTVVVDVTDGAALGAAVEAAGPLDILFNCAGWVAHGDILQTSPGDWLRSFETNVTSMYYSIRAALPAMIERRTGSIINVSSVVSSIQGVPNRVAYGASKAAVIGLTKNVAADVIDKGIRVNALCPGTTQSPSLDDRIAATGDLEAGRAAFIARQPMGRLGRPEEMARAVVWLASDESAFATGTTIVVDGGQTL